MHNALYVEEILLDVFSYCYAFRRRARGHPFQRSYANRDLAAIARTCRTFKDLALDMIWAELPNLSPLARCLPNLSTVDSQGVYSFQRQLEDAEWETLRSYTSRVRVLVELLGTSGLAVDCVNQLSNSPNSSEPLFPRLQKLGVYKVDVELYPFVLRHLTRPDLTNLTLKIPDSSHGTILRSFGHLCPSVDYFKAVNSGPYADVISDLICRWSHIRHVICYDVVLNGISLSHLSKLPSILTLAFMVNDSSVNQFPVNSTLQFSTLKELSVNSGSLVPLWRIFRRTSFPALRAIRLGLFQVHPTPANFLSMLTSLREACSHDTLDSLALWTAHVEEEIAMIPIESPCQLTFNLLRPLTVFHNLQAISVDVDWGVDLTESELLYLASSWPRLEKLRLGDEGDWTPSSGITPTGLVHLISTCRSLRVLFVILDTRDFTEIPRGHPWRGLTMPDHAFLHLLNSPIEEDAVNALGVFFQVAPYPYFNLTTHWNSHYFRGRRPQARDSMGTYYARWARARDIARDLSEFRRELLKSIRRPEGVCFFPLKKNQATR